MLLLICKLIQCALWGHSSKGLSLIAPKIKHHWKYYFMAPSAATCIASNSKVHPNYAQGYVITCVGNLTEEKSVCRHVWISHRRMNAGSVFKLQLSNNDVSFFVTNLRWRNLVPWVDSAYDGVSLIQWEGFWHEVLWLNRDTILEFTWKGL
jgi:hypothetical protein